MTLPPAGEVSVLAFSIPFWACMGVGAAILVLGMLGLDFSRDE